MLTCPECGCRFPLTFARYFKAGPGRYVCPQCQAQSTLVLPTWLKTIERIISISGAAVAGFIIVSRPVPGILLMVGWFAINIPLNVLLDGRFGALHSKRVPPQINP